MNRDMSKAQFMAAMRARGFARAEFGYWRDTVSGVNICPANVGSNRRAQLAYTIAEVARLSK